MLAVHATKYRLWRCDNAVSPHRHSFTRGAFSRSGYWWLLAYADCSLFYESRLGLPRVNRKLWTARLGRLTLSHPREMPLGSQVMNCAIPWFTLFRTEMLEVKMLLLRECSFNGRVQVTLAPPLLHWPTPRIHDLGRHIDSRISGPQMR
jgi:hypothetical protein